MTIELESMMPHAAPVEPIARTMLIAMRRIAIAGVDDAVAANLLLGRLGMGYRRPLMFLRVLMSELARVSDRAITIAPPCCNRMTEGEAALLFAIDSGRAEPDMTRGVLAWVTGSLECLGALSVAQALGDALEDLGRPLRL